jgi:hypothetical protein
MGFTLLTVGAATRLSGPFRLSRGPFRRQQHLLNHDHQ